MRRHGALNNKRGGRGPQFGHFFFTFSLYVLRSMNESFGATAYHSGEYGWYLVYRGPHEAQSHKILWMIDTIGDGIHVSFHNPAVTKLLSKTRKSSFHLL